MATPLAAAAAAAAAVAVAAAVVVAAFHLCLLMLPGLALGPQPWHPTRPNKGAMWWEGPFHSMRWGHGKAPWSWWWPPVHHVRWHGPRWHHREPLQMWWRHPWGALEWDQARSGTKKTGRGCLEPNYRTRCNSLSAKQ